MIYKEYDHIVCETQQYRNDYSYKELFVKLQEGWEIVTSFIHTHPNSTGRYEYDRVNGNRNEIFEIGIPHITFILGRSEAPKALYGK